MNRSLLVVTVVAIVAVAGMAAAQATTTLEIKQRTVVSNWDNDLVVKMSDGVIRHVEVPEGFTFNVDHKELPVSALKPGMNLTAVIKTTTGWVPHLAFIASSDCHERIVKFVDRGCRFVCGRNGLRTA